MIIISTVALMSNSRKSKIHFSRRMNHMKIMKIMLILAGFLLMISTSDIAQASKVLGTGTNSLLGGDLTDPEDDGKPEEDKKIQRQIHS